MAEDCGGMGILSKLMGTAESAARGGGRAAAGRRTTGTGRRGMSTGRTAATSGRMSRGTAGRGRAGTPAPAAGGLGKLLGSLRRR
jgi:hypothetical protein